MELKQGDIVTVAPPGDFGKPRPALVLQRRVAADSEMVTVALITSDLSYERSIRVVDSPDAENGLRHTSAIMIDSIQSFRRRKVGRMVGHLEADVLDQVRTAVLTFLGYDE